MNPPDEQFSFGQDEIARRLDFIGFTEEDAERIRALRPYLHSVTEEVADDLYAQIRTIPKLANILQGHLNQCKIKQSAYLRQLLNARIDRLYTASRAWVGEVHRHMGVEPGWYIAAYSYLMELLFERLAEHMQDDPGTAWMISRSVTKLVHFDMILSLDAYSQGLVEVDRSRVAALRESAAPTALEVWPGVVVLPISGALDAERTNAYHGAILQSLLSTHAKALIFDMSRIPEIDLETGEHLFGLAREATEMGVTVVVAGITESLENQIASVGLATGDVVLVRRLPDAVQHVLKTMNALAQPEPE